MVVKLKNPVLKPVKKKNTKKKRKKKVLVTITLARLTLKEMEN